MERKETVCWMKESVLKEKGLVECVVCVRMFLIAWFLTHLLACLPLFAYIWISLSNQSTEWICTRRQGVLGTVHT